MSVSNIEKYFSRVLFVASHNKDRPAGQQTSYKSFSILASWNLSQSLAKSDLQQLLMEGCRCLLGRKKVPNLAQFLASLNHSPVYSLGHTGECL